MKIAFLMNRYATVAESPVMPKAASLLAEWGAEVDVVHPDEGATDLTSSPRHDVYVLKSGTETALSIAGALDAAGATIVNPYRVAAAARDKVIATRILADAGVPVPETFVATDPAAFAPMLDGGPLVLKPSRGSRGRGVRVVRTEEELGAETSDGQPILAQRYHEREGLDHKIYVIGGQVFGVLREWPARTMEQKLGRPAHLTDEMVEVSLQAGRAFGIELYGLDIVMSQGRPYVVDFSSFPGFKGVPDAGLRLADYLYATAERLVAGGPLVAPRMETVA